MPSIDDIQKELIEEFSYFGDWMEKYEYIISLAKELEDMPESAKTDEHLVRGCQSRVWLNARLNGDRLEFMADSDAVITKGLVALLVRVLSGQRPEDILKADLYMIDRLGLRQHLSPNRANGLASMVQKMKNYAMAYDAKLKGK